MKPFLFPVFLRLEGRPVLVVGGGAVAGHKAVMLLEAGAQVTVVAPRIDPVLADPRLTLVRRRFRARDVDGVWYVVAAAPPAVNRAVARAAHARQVFVNAVDDPDAASAWAGGVLRRDGLTVAISSEGTAPALVRLLREALDSILPEDLPRWLGEASAERRRWKAHRVPLERRTPLLLAALNRLYERSAP